MMTKSEFQVVQIAESARLVNHSSDKILEALDQTRSQAVFHETADPLAMLSEACCKPLKSCESAGKS